MKYDVLERGTIDEIDNIPQFVYKKLPEYCDLINWYLRRFNLPEFYCGEGALIGVYQGHNIFIDLLYWTVCYKSGEYKIPHTRTQFADKLAQILAEHNAACMLIACLLPQPIAEEIIPQITAHDRTNAIMGAYMAPAFETGSLI